MGKLLHRTQKSRVEWGTKNIKRMFDNGEITDVNAVQRGLVWTVEKNSLLIESLLLDNPVPPVYVAKYGDTYSLIDGKQRNHAITSFMNNEYALTGLKPVEIENMETGDVEEVDLNGLLYSELPEELKDIFDTTTLTVVVVDTPTDDEVCEIFYKLNNGNPLNAITTTRVKAKSRKIITDIGQHELFKNALTEKAFERYTNEDIVVKSWVVLHEEKPSLETKVIRPLMERIDISFEDKRQLVKCYDRILKVHRLIEDKKIAKRILTRTHLISLMPVVWKSIQSNITEEQFAEWFITFFAGKRSATISQTYNDAAGAGSARKESVAKRLSELDKHFTEYFKENKSNVA